MKTRQTMLSRMRLNALSFPPVVMKERLANQGLRIKHFVADNWRFTDKVKQDEVRAVSELSAGSTDLG